MSEWIVYVLRCSDDSLYTGITTDLQRRLHEHNHDNKKAAAYTRSRRPVEVVYSETLDSRSEASKRESQIKQLARVEKQLLINNTD